MIKKGLPYIIGSLVLLFLVVLLMASRTRRFDERITLRQRNKIPYGTAVARQLLPSLFPQAEIYTDAVYPGGWDEIDTEDTGQAVILVADYLNADNEELASLSEFAENGNTVFIIARAFSSDAAAFFHLRVSSDALFFPRNEDSLQLRLNRPLFATDSLFVYPGKKFEGSFYQTDKNTVALLGRSGNGGVNFIQLNKGRGHFYLHASPLAFSNYFILHKQNIRYFQQALSVIPPDTKVVLWNEYFLQKQNNPEREGEANWLGALFSVPAFRWGLLTALFFLLLFVLLEMRRKQRTIPPHPAPKNDSLDFVQTLGRLYYDKGDHRNLAEKMSSYFLEHVRSTYKIGTHTLDENFVRSLHVKSGYPVPQLNTIVSFIKELHQQAVVTEEDLGHIHQQLELFYQNT